MRIILFFILLVINLSCHKKINEIEFNDNPFDSAFNGEIFTIINTEPQDPTADPQRCILYIQFTPSAHESFSTIAARNDGKITSLIPRVNGAAYPIYNSQKLRLEGTGAIYDPGFSRFHEIAVTDVLNIPFTRIPGVSENSFEVSILYRNKFNANSLNRREELKQSSTFECL